MENSEPTPKPVHVITFFGKAQKPEELQDSFGRYVYNVEPNNDLGIPDQILITQQPVQQGEWVQIRYSGGNGRYQIDKILHAGVAPGYPNGRTDIIVK
ncbi:MAG: hypothetical protein JST35_05100 [Armatimonadetes bacterium]|nr:hypothetical protein [Armatimonadota bacterium]